ncbi:MAG: hypothetical protein QOH63_1932 [Acidobacteriota bacterium]|jgi:hypothetical protein|nr:hypothetical protein [Acidobacteriota bacterium]
MKRLVTLFIAISICSLFVFAQEQEHPAVAINFKDFNKKPINGTLVSLDLTQISVETDDIHHLGLKIDLRQVASIIFFDIPLTLKTDKPISDSNSKMVTCGATSVKRPELRGLRLGMSISDVKTAKPELRLVIDAPDSVGQQTAFVVGAEEGVRSLDLEFLDGSLTSIKVTYDHSVSWNNEQEFLSRLADAFGLPTPWNGYLKCEGLNLVADYSYGIAPKIRLYDPNSSQIIKKRRADTEEKKRREFKP